MLISVTPVTCRNRGEISHSNIVRNSIGEWLITANFELQNFTQRRGQRTDGGRAVLRRDHRCGIGQTFGDQLPRSINIGAFLEHDRDDGDTELGNAA